MSKDGSFVYPSSLINSLPALEVWKESSSKSNKNFNAFTFSLLLVTFNTRIYLILSTISLLSFRALGLLFIGV